MGVSSSQKLIQTHCYTEFGDFFVSTINRQSSAIESYDHRYAETMVWEWNESTRERGDLIGQGEGSEYCIRRHQSIVESLFKWGSIDEPEGDLS